MANSTENVLLLFTQIDHWFVNGDNLIVEQFVFVCFWYSGQPREQTSNKMSARK